MWSNKWLDLGIKRVIWQVYWWWSGMSTGDKMAFAVIYWREVFENLEMVLGRTWKWVWCREMWGGISSDFHIFDLSTWGNSENGKQVCSIRLLTSHLPKILCSVSPRRLVWLLCFVAVVSEPWPPSIMCYLICVCLDLAVGSYPLPHCSFTHSLCIDFPSICHLSTHWSGFLPTWPFLTQKSSRAFLSVLCSWKAVRTPWLCHTAHRHMFLLTTLPPSFFV